MPKIFLFRERFKEFGRYDLVDMGSIRKALPAKLFLEQGIRSGVRTLNDVSNDWVLMGNLVGNDFVPKLKSFLFLRDGLERMVRAYSKISNGGVYNEITRTDVNGNVSINHSGFMTLLMELAPNEARDIQDQSKYEHKEEIFVDETLLRNIQTLGGGMKKFNFDRYRIDYYQKSGIDLDALGPSAKKAKTRLRQMCLDYLKTLQFVLIYYCQKNPSWTWSYEWYYPPLIRDLLSTVETMSEEEKRQVYDFNDPGTPALPFVQLLSILPPASAALLPRPLRSLLADPNSPLTAFNPTEFEIDYEGKTQEHLGVVILPFADFDIIYAAYNPIAARIKNRYVRNELARPGSFQFNKNYFAKYESDYGVIEEMHVQKTLI